jgi:UPF0755 protein
MVDAWLNEILDRLNIEEAPAQEGQKEIGADEAAIASAKLTHPDDMELERIVQETLAENWSDSFEEDKQAAPAEASHPQKSTMPPLQEFNDEESEEHDEYEESINDRFLEKLHPKAKKGSGLFGIPHLIATVVWLCIIVAVGVSIGRLVWVCAADLLALGMAGQEITITVEETDDLDDVAEKLQKAGMIRYPGLFKMFADLTGKGNNILVGAITFSDETVYDYNALINAMSYRGGSSVTVEIMIPEGYNCAQIFALLEEKGVCSVSALEEYAANGELENYWFLDGVKRGHKYCLEGFMFPDTYKFYLEDEPRRVIEKFLNDFEYRFSDRMIDKFVALNQKTGLKLSIRDVVIMASIVEKEKANALEGYTIASVFYNRLMNSANYPFLNSDATILYDTEYYSKGELTTDAQISASPYNTYTQAGLPAGPIANPGLASLDAALDPEETKYHFFIFDKEAGVHRFSRSLTEHEQWARKLGLT